MAKWYRQNTSYGEILRDSENESKHNPADLRLPYGLAKGLGFSGAAICNIYCPKGTKMLYIEPHSYYKGGTEREMLLQRGTEFRMTKYEKGTDGRWYIDLEVTDQSPLDLDEWYKDVPF